MFDIESGCIRAEDECTVYIRDECGVVMCGSRKSLTVWMESKQWYVKELEGR